MLYFTNHTNLTAHWWMYWDRQSWVINVAKCTKRSTLLKQFTSITSLKERKQIMAFCCIELVANFSMVSPVETFQFGRLGKAGGNTWWDYNCNNGCLHHVCMPFQSVIYEDRCLRNMFAGNKKGRPPWQWSSVFYVCITTSILCLIFTKTQIISEKQIQVSDAYVISYSCFLSFWITSSNKGIFPIPVVEIFAVFSLSN